MILGCAMPEAEQGLNVARIASLRAGVPVTASAVTVNRFCSSGLQAIAYAAERIMRGGADVDRRRRHRVDEHGADGRQQDRAEPGAGRQLSRRLPHDRPRRREPRRATTAISREEQDAFALRSHQRAVAAIDAGRFGDEIVPVPSGVRPPDAELRTFEADEGPRRDTSLEALAKLKPAFHAKGIGDRRQLVADERRRGRGRRHERRARCATLRPDAARPLRRRSRPPASSRNGSASARCRRSARC